MSDCPTGLTTSTSADGGVVGHLGAGQGSGIALGTSSLKCTASQAADETAIPTNQPADISAYHLMKQLYPPTNQPIFSLAIDEIVISTNQPTDK